MNTIFPEEELLRINSKIQEILSQLRILKRRRTNGDDSQLRSELWELSKEKFVLETRKDPEFKRYRGIIFTVGFSPEPIILNILANEPEYMYFIYTKESEKCIDVVIEETKIKPSQYQKAQIPRESAADSYHLVKKGVKFLIEEKGVKKTEIGLDPTGGTKIMSVGCGIAASIFDLNILYINNKRYNPELRRPEPGSEILVSVPNPFDIYQDDKIHDGLRYLDSLNFSLAREIFYSIMNSSSNPLFPELIATIAEILYNWDAINYSGALRSIVRARTIISKLSVKLLKVQDKLMDILDSWEGYLHVIDDQIKKGSSEVEKISPLLVFDIKENADREFYKGNYNNAALKYYRVIEMVNQYILLTFYNLNTQDPNFEKLPEAIIQGLLEGGASKEMDIKEGILRNYNAIWAFIYEKTGKKDSFKEGTLLPPKIGLLAGIVLRHVFGDTFIEREFILRVFNAIEKRNMSIFAHGIVPVSKKDCEGLKDIAKIMIQKIEIDQEIVGSVFSGASMKVLTELIAKTM